MQSCLVPAVLHQYSKKHCLYAFQISFMESCSRGNPSRACLPPMTPALTKRIPARPKELLQQQLPLGRGAAAGRRGGTTTTTPRHHRCAPAPGGGATAPPGGPGRRCSVCKEPRSPSSPCTCAFYLCPPCLNKPQHK